MGAQLHPTQKDSTEDVALDIVEEIQDAKDNDGALN